MTKKSELDARLAELKDKRVSVERALATSTAAWKKCRQMRGADAYKRAWYFEEQMEKSKTALTAIDEELAALEVAT